jgi:DNA polymerase III subunit epsilon
MYLFFDTETNGLPKNYNAVMTDVDNWPRIIQLAYILTDENGKEIESYCELIKPEGWTIPREKFWIDNGYATELSMERGVPIQQALQGLAKSVEQSKVMIAHNLAFDRPIVGAEMFRAKLNIYEKPTGFCTMRATTNLCKLPGRYGYKWPKLEELHHFLFKEGFEGAHDALNDVRATIKCFFELKNKNLIETP